MKTTLLTDQGLNHFFRNTSTGAGLCSVGLLTAIADKEAGTVTPASYTGYATQSITFGAPLPSDGGRFIANSATVTFPQNGGTSQDVIGTAVFRTGSADILAVSFIDSSNPFVSTVTSSGGSALWRAPNHGLANAHKFRVDDVPSAVQPTGVNENTDYFVVSSSTDEFRASLTLAGVPITVSTLGAVQVTPYAPVTINTNDTPQIASGALSLTDD